MTKTEFARLADLHRLRGATRQALHLVLVGGLSGYAAAQQTGVAKSTVSRALKRIEYGTCACCGQPLPVS